MTTGRCSTLLSTSAALALTALVMGGAGSTARASADVSLLLTTGVGSEVRRTIEDRARQMLVAARKGRSWVTPRGVTRWPILVNDELRGSLWENVDLPTLGFGDYWQAGDGARIELTHDGRVVGMLWVHHD
jgi:hypothetical protein